MPTPKLSRNDVRGKHYDNQHLHVRVDSERRRKLMELAAQGTPVSETVRRLIDRAYEDMLRSRRRRAALEAARLEIEDAPTPATLSRQLESAHEPGGLSAPGPDIGLTRTDFGAA